MALGQARRSYLVMLAGVVVFSAACTTTQVEGATSTAPPAPASSTTRPATSTSPSLTISESVAEYFASNGDDRDEIAHEIAERVSTDDLGRLLHEAVRYPGHEPGRSTAASPIGFNQNRQIVVRTPAGYDPTQTWPLIVAYHGWGGEAGVIIDRLERLLGPEIENYVVAAPDDYRQTVIDAPPPVSSEHVSIWRTVRQRWHVDTDRTYLAGYSLGGDTVLTVASMHPGHIAGGLAMAAGAAYPTDVDGLVERFLVQLSPIQMLHVCGSEDSLNIVGLNFQPQDITLAEQGELVAGLIDDLGLSSYEVLRLEGVGHSDVFPTVGEALVPLSAVRAPLPPHFSHSFRYIHQADAFWVEGHEWLGNGWLTPMPEMVLNEGESEEEALARTIHSLLGRIDASIDDQTIEVNTEHLADFTVWLHADMIDWSRPVTLVVNGATVYDGNVEPSTGVALAQALRTYEFDRLRLAGIRVDAASGTAHIVTPSEEFPDIVRGITF